METDRRIIIATSNAGKVREFAELTTGLGLVFTTPAEIGIDIEVEETGNTFAENAKIKATAYAQASGMLAMADDSGLEIDALDGRPGVLSARYGGAHLDFAQRMRIILDELHSIADRSASFVCSIVLADSSGRSIAHVEGRCEGRIAEHPIGNGGFGYDPIFIPNGYDDTFGVLPADVKNLISHRKDAISKIIPFLRDYSVF